MEQHENNTKLLSLENIFLDFGWKWDEWINLRTKPSTWDASVAAKKLKA